VFANGTVRRSWQDEDVRSVKKISGEGGKCQLWFYFTVSTKTCNLSPYGV
jgi:hypothetical protein